MSTDVSLCTAEFLERLRRAPQPLDEPPLPRVPGTTILEAVGRGGTGIVYRARDEAGGREVAVKVLWRAADSSPDSVGRARREAEILARLHHPNIVRILDTGECSASPAGAGKVPYLTMEWVGGGTLAWCVGEAAISCHDAVRIVRDLALALAEVHDHGIVHRDVKPANVLLAGDEASGWVPKLADFGLARGEAAGDGVTQEGAVLGTVGYLAPEQVGGGAVGPATDIHGLGATLYFLFTGRPPHDAPGTVATLVRAIRGAVDWSAPGLAGIHPDLQTVLHRCLAPDPTARYASARDLADDLDRHLLGRRVRARRAGLVTRCVRWAGRHPATAAGALLSAASLFALAGWAGLEGTRAAAARRAVASADVALQESRAVARDSRDVARAALARFTDDHFREILARGDVLDKESHRMLAEVRDAYLRWPGAEDDRGEAIFRAAGLRRVAGLLREVGRTAAAADTYAEARAVLDAADRGGPDDAAWNGVRLDTLVEEYRFLVDSGRAAEAEPLVARAIALLDMPLAPPRAFEQRGSVLLDRGFVLSALGRHEESAAITGELIAALRTAREARPDDRELARAEQSALWNASICAARGGRTDEQIGLLRALLGGSEDAFGRCPEESREEAHIALLATAVLADVELAAGQRAESRAIARRGVARARFALEVRPGDETLQADLIEVAVRAVRAGDDPAELAEDAPALAEGIALAGGIVAREPAVFAHVHRLFMALREQARLLNLQGDHAGALATRARMRRELAPWLASADHGEMVAAWSTTTAVDASGDAWREGDGPGTIALLEEAIALAPPPLRGGVLAALAHAAISLGDRDRGRTAAEEALQDPAAEDNARAALARLGQ